MALELGKNCYISYAEAVFYMENRLHTALWDEAAQIDCENALIMATRRIDCLPFYGVKADKAQSLQFPREGQEMPQSILDAVCEEALEFLKGGNKRAELRQAGVKSYKIGSLSENLEGMVGIGLSSAEARALIAPYMGVAYID